MMPAHLRRHASAYTATNPPRKSSSSDVMSLETRRRVRSSLPGLPGMIWEKTTRRPAGCFEIGRTTSRCRGASGACDPHARITYPQTAATYIDTNACGHSVMTVYIHEHKESRTNSLTCCRANRTLQLRMKTIAHCLQSLQPSSVPLHAVKSRITRSFFRTQRSQLRLLSSFDSPRSRTNGSACSRRRSREILVFLIRGLTSLAAAKRKCFVIGIGSVDTTDLATIAMFCWVTGIAFVSASIATIQKPPDLCLRCESSTGSSSRVLTRALTGIERRTPLVRLKTPPRSACFLSALCNNS